MKSIAIISIEAQPGRMSVKIRSPGKVRGVIFIGKPKLVLNRGEPNFDEVPMLFIEGQKGAPIVERTFQIALGHIREPIVFDIEDEDRYEHVGSCISSRGAVVHVYEIHPTIEVS